MNIKDLKFETELLHSIKFSKLSTRFSVWKTTKVRDEYAGRKKTGAMDRIGSCWGCCYEDARMARLTMIGGKPAAKLLCWVLIRCQEELLKALKQHNIILSSDRSMFEVVSYCDIALARRFIALATVKGTSPYSWEAI